MSKSLPTNMQALPVRRNSSDSATTGKLRNSLRVESFPGYNETSYLSGEESDINSELLDMVIKGEIDDPELLQNILEQFNI